MTQDSEHSPGQKKHTDKLKKADFSPWRYLLSIVAFLAALLLLPAVFRGSRSIWDAFAWFYLLIAAVATLIEVIQGRVQLRIGRIFSLFISYIMRIFVEILLLALGFPVIVLMFILGPLMFLICLVSLGLVAMYFIEEILRIDFKGITVPYGGLTALGFLAAMVVSGLVFYKFYNKTEQMLDFWFGKIVDAFLFINNRGHYGKQKPDHPGEQTDNIKSPTNKTGV